MKSDRLESLLRYRMQQAHETLREAEILLEQSALRGTVNRAYYAMFYALLALLATRAACYIQAQQRAGLFDRDKALEWR